MHIYYIYCEANKLKYMCIYISVFLGHQRYIDRERERLKYIYPQEYLQTCIEIYARMICKVCHAHMHTNYIYYETT